MNEYNEIAKQKISEWLKELMDERKISANQLIKKTGLHKKTVYSILQMGNFNPNYEMDNLLKICEILEINICIQ